MIVSRRRSVAAPADVSSQLTAVEASTRADVVSSLLVCGRRSN